MEITVRLGSSRDYAFALDLGRRTIESSISELRPAPVGEAEEAYGRLTAFLFDRPHVLLIAESAMEKVGFLMLTQDIPDEVSGMPQAFIAYMATETHATRRGTGRRLLEEAERIARERGLPALALMVTEGNQAAREMYAQAGFSTERRLLVKPLQ